MIETTETRKCDKPRCNQSSTADLLHSTFGGFQITYVMPNNDSAHVEVDLCKKHAEEAYSALVGAGLIPDLSAGQ